ncbi:MAG: single-stranded-DNA-specific exonuclease RecJ [Patescibacteria group bacterium]
MNTHSKRWKVLNKLPKTKKETSEEDVINLLLENRGLETSAQKEEFFKPTHPDKITLRKLGIKKTAVEKAIERIKKAIKNKEKIIVFGDYDADGITGTAILWERLHGLKADVSPYLPDRFSEGYGLNGKTMARLKEENPNLGLIISVDSGIVAVKPVKEANKLGIDVIITDHHQLGKKIPEAFSIIHSTEICGAAVAWIFAREIKKKIRIPKSKIRLGDGLDLAAIGTLADMVPLVGPNRSFAKYGLEILNKTNRPGLLSLFEAAGLKKGEIGAYAIGFIISPRLNATGRVSHCLDSLRLLCTRNRKQADELAQVLNETNTERQKLLGDVVVHAKESARKITQSSILVMHEDYHEGVIGLAASRLVEEFYKPTIIVSKGKKISKASARSVKGFDIVKALRLLEDLLIDVGGHPMAAGFSIETKNLSKFKTEFNKKAERLINKKLLKKELKIDLEVDFNLLTRKLVNKLAVFEPTGIGNPAPVFSTKKVAVIDVRVVGKTGRHLKLKLQRDGKLFDAIAFGLGELSMKLSLGSVIDIAYKLEENVWNGTSSLQLNIGDIKIKESY